MKVVIVGAGPAGVTVAETLRHYDDHLKIVMLSSEPFPPYAPPAMVEYFMTNQEVHFWKGRDFAERAGLDYRLMKRVISVLPEQHLVHLEDGEVISYDRLVLATGSRLYAPVPGADKAGIYNFKSLSAAEELVQQVREGRAHSAIIVGAGFIGVEIGLLLRHLGVKVTQIEMTNRVMPRMLDTEMAEFPLGVMRERGIDIRLNTKALAFLGEARAEALQLQSGETLTADLLVVATGLKPNVEFLENSGIEVHRGVVVDDHLCTSVPDVYAAGDVAETVNRVSGKRDIHAIFPNAVAQGQVVAYNLLGWNVTYEGADTINSLKHLGLPLISAGEMEGEELKVQRDNVLRKLYVLNSRITGFRLAGDISSAGIFRELMNKRVDVAAFKKRLMEVNFGMGYIAGLALSPLWMV